ncbi:hypothetical protein [Paratractidigestivibacter sp.]|uniref:hypothetical protein n=1 Tax=Paratractidigestivibacter sp. TaxID=2847316 RepID=UPI002ABD48D7|nr:hypothetical protein [Paratractidigestivibacter sp.]
MSKKNSWYKPNFWTLAYLDEASMDKGGSRPVGGCGGFLRAVLDVFVFLAVFLFICWVIIQVLTIVF